MAEKKIAPLKMIHLFDKIETVPVPQGFTCRNFKNGEEEIWVNLCKNGIIDENADVETEWYKRIVKTGLEPEKDIFFVCDESGKPVATFAGYMLPDGTGNVHMVAAAPEARGKGLGKFMVSAVIQKMDKEVTQQPRMLRLTTHDFRLPAVCGYLKGGFHPVLYDEGMEDRWKKVCQELNFTGTEMLDFDGNPTGIML